MMNNPPISSLAYLQSPIASSLVDMRASASSANSQSKKRENNKKQNDQRSYRKAPGAPKRFKSSYILFFMAKQEEIKRSLPEGSTVGDVSKKSSLLWKNLPPHERAYWDHCAEQDKQRYLREKKSYTGPWQIPYKRAKKDPRAPKRPMSSFLYFSRARRDAIKAEFPNMKNTEISSLLGEQWRNATEEERRPYVEMELQQRKLYKIALEQFNRNEELRKQQAAAFSTFHAQPLQPQTPLTVQQHCPPPQMTPVAMAPPPPSTTITNTSAHRPPECYPYYQPSSHPNVSPGSCGRVYNHDQISNGNSSTRHHLHTNSPIQMVSNMNQNGFHTSSSSSLRQSPILMNPRITHSEVSMDEGDFFTFDKDIFN